MNACQLPLLAQNIVVGGPKHTRYWRSQCSFQNPAARKSSFSSSNSCGPRCGCCGNGHFLTAEEKQELLELGEPIGSGLKHLISIVSYGSFLRWKRQARGGDEPKKMGRPRTLETLKDLIVKIASETGWGYTRVMGELKKLGIKPPSRNTLKKIMKEASHAPWPDNGKGSWAESLEVYAET